MRSVLKLNRQSSSPNKLQDTKKKAFIVIGLATVLGLGWGFGLLATSSDLKAVTLVFQIIFSIFVGCQGLLLFILHGLQSAEARKEWKLWFSKISSKSMKLYTVVRSSSMMPLSEARPSSQPTSPSSSMYEMSDISKGSTLPRARKDQMELSVEEKLGNETLEAKESPQPTRKQSLVQKAIQSLTPGKHAQYDFLQGSETPPTLRKEPVVLMTVCESSAEDQTDSTTAEATTSGDQQENEGHTVPPASHVGLFYHHSLGEVKNMMFSRQVKVPHPLTGRSSSRKSTVTPSCQKALTTLLQKNLKLKACL